MNTPGVVGPYSLAFLVAAFLGMVLNSAAIVVFFALLTIIDVIDNALAVLVNR